MAEWTGRKRTLNSIIPEGQPPAGAASDHLPASPEAPGAVDSPQLPGATPDNPALPGHPRETLAPLMAHRRPLTEYGTAQRILGMFTPAPGTALEPSDWEQGPAAAEEMRKTNPAFLTPPRPLGGYGLGIGRAASALAPAEVEAIGQTDDTREAIPVAVEGIMAASAPPASAEVAVSETPAATPADSIQGDGTATCPPGFPVKGNVQSRIYHTTASRVYAQTIAEICFASAEAAEAAGFRPPKN